MRGYNSDYFCPLDLDWNIQELLLIISLLEHNRIGQRLPPGSRAQSMNQITEGAVHLSQQVSLTSVTKLDPEEGGQYQIQILLQREPQS